MSEYSLDLTSTPDEQDREFVIEQLKAFNQSHSPALVAARQPEQDWHSFAVLLRDTQGQIVGGLLGQTSLAWGWLEIGVLWVEGSLRHSGYGSQLMQRAEAEAVLRGCKYALLDTVDFQAPQFYQKLGYKIVGTIEEYPPGTNTYFMRKDLGA